MKNRRGFGLLLTTTLVLTAGFVVAPLPGALAHAAGPVDRHDWSVGVATRVGRATVELHGAPADLDWSRGASPQFRVGRVLGEHWMIGLQERQWLNEGGLSGYKVRGNVQNFGLVLTSYPGRTTNMTSGIFLELGAGLAHGRITALEPYEGGANQWGETYETVYKHDAKGWGAMVGAGYEFRISSHFAAGVSMSYNYLEFDDEIFDRVEFVPGGLNLNWYF